MLATMWFTLPYLLCQTGTNLDDWVIYSTSWQFEQASTYLKPADNFS